MRTMTTDGGARASAIATPHRLAHIRMKDLKQFGALLLGDGDGICAARGDIFRFP